MKAGIADGLKSKVEATQLLVGDGTMDVSSACEFTGLGRTYLYSLMDRGHLRYAKVGKRRLIPRAELVRLLADGIVGEK
jgi:excisionase family DNA binding protein